MARERRWPDLKTSLENIEKGIIDCSSDAFPPYDLEDWEILGELAPDQTAADSFAQFAEGSPAYQAILDEGRVQEAKRIVLLLGSQRFGPPSAPLRAALEAVSDLSQIEDVARYLLDAPSWDKLLAGQASRR